MTQGDVTGTWQTVASPKSPLPSDKAIVLLDNNDDVAVAARDIVQGENLGAFPALENIPKGHKVAMSQIKKSQAVRKYAQLIGYAKKSIKQGSHVHGHNLGFRNTSRKLGDYSIGSETRKTRLVGKKDVATFLGYKRQDGKVGTRNYVAIISSVNCSSTAARRIAAAFTRKRLGKYPNVDGVAAFVHGTGCGMSSTGLGMGNLQRVMEGYATHPNVAGAVMLGLGCESNQIRKLLKDRGLALGDTLVSLGIQSSGGLDNAVKSGIKAVEKLLERANDCRRTACPASEITLALQCGGSDSWSGITANPALGHATDLLVAQGGTAVIAETPESYGAEHLLAMRASSRKVAKKLVDKIHWWESHVAREGGSMDNNPSPGNKQGGLTTILEKSLGAVAKGGTTNLNGFYEYGEKVMDKGFVMMDSPGYDPVSVTGQIASGCNLVTFTTGRGSAFGSKPSPTLKLCSNSDTFQRMPNDMDIDCGVIVSEGVPVDKVGRQVFDRLLSFASGEASKSEEQGMGDYEFVPWQLGATM